MRVWEIFAHCMDDWHCYEIIIAPSSVLVKVRMDTQSKKYGAKHKYVT
jgi:hypothetical protein